MSLWNDPREINRKTNIKYRVLQSNQGSLKIKNILPLSFCHSVIFLWSSVLCFCPKVILSLNPSFLLSFSSIVFLSRSHFITHSLSDPLSFWLFVLLYFYILVFQMPNKCGIYLYIYQMYRADYCLKHFKLIFRSFCSSLSHTVLLPPCLFFYGFSLNPFYFCSYPISVHL